MRAKLYPVEAPSSEDPNPLKGKRPSRRGSLILKDKCFPRISTRMLIQLIPKGAEWHLKLAAKLGSIAHVVLVLGIGNTSLRVSWNSAHGCREKLGPDTVWQGWDPRRSLLEDTE